MNSNALDTVVVPAQELGFQTVFLKEHHWYAVRIAIHRHVQLKYIAAYRVAPIRAVTHVAEIAEIRRFNDEGKFVVKFKSAAREIGPIPLLTPLRAPQGPVYVRLYELRTAQSLEAAIDAAKK